MSKVDDGEFMIEPEVNRNFAERISEMKDQVTSDEPLGIDSDPEMDSFKALIEKARETESKILSAPIDEVHPPPERELSHKIKNSDASKALTDLKVYTASFMDSSFSTLNQ